MSANAYTPSYHDTWSMMMMVDDDDDDDNR
jgi:hypothetical protein